MIYMFLSNNPSSGDINLLNLPCLNIFSVAYDTHFTEFRYFMLVMVT